MINSERRENENFPAQLGLIPNKAQKKKVNNERRLHYKFSEKVGIQPMPTETKKRKAHTKVLEKLSKHLDIMMPQELKTMPPKIQYTDLFVGNNRIVYRPNEELREKCLETMKSSKAVVNAVEICKKKACEAISKIQRYN